MTEFLQQLINGISLGAIYALCALGYTMVYGVLRFINFAHGDVFMIGAFAGFYLTPLIRNHLHLPALVGAVTVLVLSMVICALLGVLIERLAYRPLRHKPRLTVLITAIGVSLFLEFTGQRFFGADPKRFPELVASVQFAPLPGLVLSSNQILVFVVTLVLLAGLRWIVIYTRTGTAMRAVSYNTSAAALMGINIDWIISFTFAVGSALGGAAGILYALNYPVIDPLMGILPGLKAFVAAVLGGIGNIPGAALGGFIIGILETFVGGTQWSTYRDAIAFAILIIILIFRPSGILGKVQVEKV